MKSDDRTFRTSRTLLYPPDTIYSAFETPDLLAVWWGPDGFANTFELFEFQVGGQWRFIMHGPDGKDYPNQNVFQALEPGRKIVIRHDCTPYFTLTIALAAVAEGTELTWEQIFDDPDTALAVKQVVVRANEQNLDRLDRVLSKACAA